MPGMTGGFGEPTCRKCHLDNPPDAPGGTLALGGVPQTFEPGRAYVITIHLAREQMRRGGFEIGARFASGPARATQAGAWRPLDDRVQIRPSQDGTLQFAQHTSGGTLAASRGEIEWQVEWTAPAAAGAPVQFNVAANASNDDASPLGDFIYTLEKPCAPVASH